MIKTLYLYALKVKVAFFGGLEPDLCFGRRMAKNNNPDHELGGFYEDAATVTELAAEFLRSWEKETGRRVSYYGVIHFMTDPMGAAFVPCLAFRTHNDGKVYILSHKENLAIPESALEKVEPFDVEDLNLGVESMIDAGEKVEGGTLNI